METKAGCWGFVYLSTGGMVQWPMDNITLVAIDRSSEPTRGMEHLVEFNDKGLHGDWHLERTWDHKVFLRVWFHHSWNRYTMTHQNTKMLLFESIPGTHGWAAFKALEDLTWTVYLVPLTDVLPVSYTHLTLPTKRIV